MYNSTVPSVALINPINTDSDVTNNSIVISWDAPAYTGKESDGKAATIIGYKVYYKEGTTVTVSDGTLLNATTNEGLQAVRSAKIEGLEKNTEYTILVVAFNNIGKTSTTTARIRTANWATELGKAIIDTIAATDVTKVSISISWTEPTDKGINTDGTLATMFPNGKQNSYWSSSADNSLDAWRMHFGYRDDSSFRRTSSYYVRLVRGSQ